MAEGIIGLIIFLGVLAVVYILVKWILSIFPIPTPLPTIVDIIFAVIAIVYVFRFLLALI